MLIERLEASVFRPFGDVIEVPSGNGLAINDGRAQRFDDLVRSEVVDGRLGVSIFRTDLAAIPLTLRMLERHPKGSQAFVPLAPSRFLVAVAPAGAFDPTGVRLFLAAAGQGVNYLRGTWHHPLLALDGSRDYLVLDRLGPGDNCDMVELASPLEIGEDDLGSIRP